MCVNFSNYAIHHAHLFHLLLSCLYRHTKINAEGHLCKRVCSGVTTYKDFFPNVKCILYHFIIMTVLNSRSKCYTLNTDALFLIFLKKKKAKGREVVMSAFAIMYFCFCSKSVLFKSLIFQTEDKTINLFHM